LNLYPTENRVFDHYQSVNDVQCNSRRLLRVTFEACNAVRGKMQGFWSVWKVKYESIL